MAAGTTSLEQGHPPAPHFVDRAGSATDHSFTLRNVILPKDAGTV